jgi:phosphomannomutase
VSRSAAPGGPPAGQPHNGIPAGELAGLRWQKGKRGADAVEMARLPDGSVAVRNADDPDGPALIYTKAEIEALIGGAADGDFDDLVLAVLARGDDPRSPSATPRGGARRITVH